MAEQFGVTPDELRSVSGDLHDVSSQMKGVMSTLRAQVDGEGAGGEAIAAGDTNSFWAQFDWAGGSVDAKTGLLDYYHDYLGRAANTFQGSDG